MSAWRDLSERLLAPTVRLANDRIMEAYGRGYRDGYERGREDGWDEGHDGLSSARWERNPYRNVEPS